MARKVARSEIVDYETYQERREVERAGIMAIKRVRRVHLGDVLAFLFENTATIRYQIQEMMRTERIVKEAAILHEIATYNDILGGPGELGCSLFIEIDDAAERRRKLGDWLDLPAHVYVRLADGTKVQASFDPRQVGDDRLSAVQYLKFTTQGRVPVAIGSDFPALAAEQPLDAAVQQALGTDLAE